MVKKEVIEDKDYIKALLKDEPFTKLDKVGKFDISEENAMAALRYLENNNKSNNISKIETNDDVLTNVSSDKLYMLDGEMLTKEEKEVQLVLKNKGASSVVLIAVMISILLIGLVLMLFSVL